MRKLLLIGAIFGAIILIYLLINTITLTNRWYQQSKQIQQLEVQVNSLWENVQQLQNEYSKIVDKLYNKGAKNE